MSLRQLSSSAWRLVLSPNMVMIQWIVIVALRDDLRTTWCRNSMAIHLAAATHHGHPVSHNGYPWLAF